MAKMATAKSVTRLWNNTKALVKKEIDALKVEIASLKKKATDNTKAINDIKVIQLGNCYLKRENGKFYIGYDSEEMEV